MSHQIYPELQRRIVLITGAAHGLGAELARAFAAQGSRLALVDIDGSGLEQVAADVADSAEEVVFEVTDLSRTEVCEPLVDGLVQQLGGLHVLVNNAAILLRVPMPELGIEDFERTLRVNLMAPYFLARAAIAHMQRLSAGGRIVNVASIAARSGGVGDIHPYAASKGGLLAMTKSLAKAVADDGILVNAILPANIESAMLRDSFPAEAVDRTLSQVPLGRTAQPEEVAALVLWLASDASSYVTGVSWDITGGWQVS